MFFHGNHQGSIGRVQLGKFIWNLCPLHGHEYSTVTELHGPSKSEGGGLPSIHHEAVISADLEFYDAGGTN